MTALAASGYLVGAPNHKDARQFGESIRSMPATELLGDPDASDDKTYRDRADVADLRSK